MLNVTPIAFKAWDCSATGKVYVYMNELQVHSELDEISFLFYFILVFGSSNENNMLNVTSIGSKAWDIIHPFRVEVPINSTLWGRIVHGEIQVKDGILTLNDTLFQKIYTNRYEW